MRQGRCYPSQRQVFNSIFCFTRLTIVFTIAYDHFNSATRPNFPEHALEPAFTASFILTSDQMMKAGFGKTTQIISASGQYCTIQWGVASLFLTLFATQNANMGMMIDIGKDLHSYVQNVSDSCDSCR
ncbi:hypothetical protein, variant 1 [Batrachochytrium dendrobatidis JEL423]|uniref:Uncharacterized protein n=1 Tax=Batrachochytrium dendrobatidis (strain JEL423) TaxID=403673 RepID=A0A177WSR1_BATDL|nr:hypothetical protein BDEG_26101 [Batrachochytrium dendrobatidis JEL423]OAJ42676.1 hypothetical protein, variant 1 [Batrachochytrium dendrobatidis JEL423]